MGKFIAVWGSPNSGKTTLSMQLANYLSKKKGYQTIVVSADYETPALPYLFPMRSNKELASFGDVLNNVNIVSEDILENMIVPKGNENLGILGFKDRENRFSYETFTAETIGLIYTELRKITDYVIIDCTSNLEHNLIANIGCQLSDKGIRLRTPDMKSLSWFGSQMEIYDSQHYNVSNQIEVLNVNDMAVNPTVLEAKTDNTKVTLPYARDLRVKMQEGSLTDLTSSQKYIKEMRKILNEIM